MSSIQIKNNQMEVKGDLNFTTVPLLAKQLGPGMAGSELSVDFSQVEECNSAGLGLLLEIIRLSRAKKLNLSLHAIPEQMQVMARAYGIEEELKAQGFM